MISIAMTLFSHWIILRHSKFSSFPFISGSLLHDSYHIHFFLSTLRLPFSSFVRQLPLFHVPTSSSSLSSYVKLNKSAWHPPLQYIHYSLLLRTVPLKHHGERQRKECDHEEASESYDLSCIRLSNSSWALVEAGQYMFEMRFSDTLMNLVLYGLQDIY